MQDQSNYLITFDTQLITTLIVIFRIDVLHGNHVALQVASVLQILERTFVPIGKKNLLFLPCNIAAVQNLYRKKANAIIIPNRNPYKNEGKMCLPVRYI